MTHDIKGMNPDFTKMISIYSDRYGSVQFQMGD